MYESIHIKVTCNYECELSWHANLFWPKKTEMHLVMWTQLYSIPTRYTEMCEAFLSYVLYMHMCECVSCTCSCSVWFFSCSWLSKAASPSPAWILAHRSCLSDSSWLRLALLFCRRASKFWIFWSLSPIWRSTCSKSFYKKDDRK